MDTVIEIKVPAVHGGDVEGGRQALVTAAVEIGRQIKAGNDAVTAARTNRESFSGMMVRCALAAIITHNRSAVETALGKGTDKKDGPELWASWQAVKFAFSEAEFLNQFLARHSLPHPKGTKWIIDGQPVDAVQAVHLEALVNSVGQKDGGIRTMVKAARAVRKAETEKREKAEALEGARIEAWITANRALATKHGLNVENAMERVTDPAYEGPAIDQILAEGADLLRQREERAEREAVEGQRQDRFVASLDFVRSASTLEELDEIIAALQDRRAALTSEALPPAEEETEEHAPPQRRRAGGRH